MLIGGVAGLMMLSAAAARGSSKSGVPNPSGQTSVSAMDGTYTGGDTYPITFTLANGLPDRGPYLRRKYELPVDAADEVEKYLETLRVRHGGLPSSAGSRRGQSRR